MAARTLKKGMEDYIRDRDHSLDKEIMKTQTASELHEINY